MVNVVFNGSVSAQAAAGETVTLTVTKQGGATETLTTTTTATRTFTLTKAYVAGIYSVVASVGADAEYQAAASTAVSFTVNLVSRTITVTVAV